MAPLNIYWGGGSPFAWRVLAGLEEKGITYDAKLLDVSKSEYSAKTDICVLPMGCPSLKMEGLIS